MRAPLLLRALAGLGLAALLGACTGGSENIQTQAGALEEVRKAVVASRNTQKAPEIVVTRALINQLDVPSLEVVAEARGQTAYLVPFSQRGDVMVWRTADNGQVVLRRGLVTATRGLGGDLVSSDFNQTLAALQSGSGSTTRRLFVRSGTGARETLTLSCRIDDLGRTQLEVVGKQYQTRHLRESCTVGQESFANEYWIEPRTGQIRQSRQWAGPTVGHLRLRLLKSASE